MEITSVQHRQAFAGWVRTGRWRIPPSADDLLRKFNPNHDPSDGRFTSGGGTGYGGGGSSGGGGRGPNWEVLAKLPPKPAEPRSATGPLTGTATGRSATTDPEPRRTVKNGYEYVIDAEGRTRKISGALHPNSEGLRSRPAQAEAGGTDRRPTDHGGHYIAPRFDGPTDAFNHFAQDANFNTGTYRVLESKWAKAVKIGEDVGVTITPSYIGRSRRPSELLVTFTISGRLGQYRFHNEHQGKPRGKH